MPRFENPPYYLTAYGLAVQRGFQGTLDQWLESLRGEKGREVELRCQDGKLQWRWQPGTQEDPGTLEWQDLIDLGALTKEAREMAGQATQAAEAARKSATIAAACSTRLEIVGRAAREYAPSGHILRVWLDGQIPEKAALMVFRRAANASSYRQNRWDRRDTGYAEVRRLSFRKGQETEGSNFAKELIPYPEVPAWMPNGGKLQNYFPLTAEDIAAGHLDIPDVYNWLLPMVKPGYDYKRDCFEWHYSRIIGARYRYRKAESTQKSGLITPAELAFAIVTPMPKLKRWEYPVLGRWTNRLAVFGNGGGCLEKDANTGNYQFNPNEIFILVR